MPFQERIKEIWTNNFPIHMMYYSIYITIVTCNVPPTRYSVSIASVGSNLLFLGDKECSRVATLTDIRWLRMSKQGLFFWWVGRSFVIVNLMRKVWAAFHCCRTSYTNTIMVAVHTYMYSVQTRREWRQSWGGGGFSFMAYVGKSLASIRIPAINHFY